MKKFSIETPVGLFVLILVSMLSFKMYDFYKETNRFKKKNLKIYNAEFDNIEGIKTASLVKIGGVSVGQVESIDLKPNFRVLVKISLEEELTLTRDATLSVSSSGIFGTKFLSITNGFDKNLLQEGDRFLYTNSSMNLENLINKFVASK